MNIIEFRFNFHLSVYWQYRSIGLNIALVPNRRQAITWANADPVHRRIFVALGSDELTLGRNWTKHAIFIVYGIFV